MKIVICGDMSVTNSSYTAFYNEDHLTAFSDTVDLYKSADFALVNLECALTECDNKIRKIGPNLKY